MTRIFVHGLGQTPQSWQQTLNCMPEEPSYCPDLSKLIDGQTAADYPALYASFCAWCDRLPGPQDLCGLSLGAVLALHRAISFPQKVRSLALIGAQFEMPGMLLGVQSAIFHLMPQKAFSGMGFSKQSVIALTRSMRRLSLREGIPKLACPALILCGEKDHINQRAAQQLKKQLPSAKYVLIPNAGHEVNLDAPQALATELMHFYRSCSQ